MHRIKLNVKVYVFNLYKTVRCIKKLPRTGVRRRGNSVQLRLGINHLEGCRRRYVTWRCNARSDVVNAQRNDIFTVDQTDR